VKLPIFWRIMLSHIGILVLSGAACLYAIVQLGSVSGTARSALETNHVMIAQQEALTDTFLSHVRYGGKFLITHTEGRHEQLRQFKRDFLGYMDLLKQSAEGEGISASLKRIERLHDQYHELFNREVAYIRARQSYAQTRYQQERDRIIENTLSELDSFKTQTRARLQEKLEAIDHGARTARKIASVTTIVVLVLGTLLSLKASKSFESPSGEPVGQTLPGHSWMNALKSRRDSAVNRLRQRTMLRLSTLGASAATRIAIWSRRSGN
jgi:CHASE3 domain sensor protein